MQNRFSLHFYSEKRSLEELLTIWDIEPSETWSRGDLIGRSPSPLTTNGFSVTFTEISDDIELCLHKFLNKHLTALERGGAASSDIVIDLECVFYSNRGIGLYLEKSLLQTIGRFDINIGISTYPE